MRQQELELEREKVSGGYTLGRGLDPPNLTGPLIAAKLPNFAYTVADLFSKN